MSAVSVKVPSPMQTLAALIRAEAIAFTRTWRALIWTVAMPLLILVLTAHSLPAGAAFTRQALGLSALAIVMGTFALGLMGYGTSLATHRDRGIFQLLRCTPASGSQVLTARITVQLAAVLIEAVVTLTAARFLFGTQPTIVALAASIVPLLVVGLTALALGQAVAALTKNSSTTTAVSRLILVALFMLSGIVGGRLGGEPTELQFLGSWSPVQLAQEVLTTALTTGQLGSHGWLQLGGLLAWVVGVGYIGLRWFQWEHD